MPFFFQSMTLSLLDGLQTMVPRKGVELRIGSNHASRSIPHRGFMYVVPLPARYTSWNSLNNQLIFACTQRYIKGEKERRRSGDPLVHHFSATQLDILARVVASLLAMGLVLIPVLILFLGGLSRGSMAAVVGCFVLVFMVALSVFVEVTPHDLFIGVAA